MYIYRITNLVNQKVYIGQTVRNYEDRFKDHKKLLKRNKHYNVHLNGSWLKYGELSFNFELIEVASTYDELDWLERYYIKFYNSTNQDFGYNIDHGGHYTKSLSLQTKEKMRKAKIGKPHTDAQKEQKSIQMKAAYVSGKRSSFWKGKTLSEEHRQRLGKANFGRKRSEEQIKKTRARFLKPIKCIETNIEYASIKDAASDIKADRNRISMNLNKKCKHVKGFTFEFIKPKIAS